MKLILLRCPNCGEPLEPGNDDVVLACNNCHTPVAIAVNGPQKMAVRFVDPGKTGKGNWWFPFWVFKGQVRIQKRETQGGSRSGRKDSEKMWGMTRHLYVPAWEMEYARSSGHWQPFDHQATSTSIRRATGRSQSGFGHGYAQRCEKIIRVRDLSH